MIETPHAVDRRTQVPIYSLYSETREPTEEMLRDVDVIVVDLQGVGCRIYTFAYTMANCMRAAKRLGKKVVVCDRPNPIGGEMVAGNVTERGHESFVGQFSLATRHGMTMGELARLFNQHFGIGCALEVIELAVGRAPWYEDRRPWVLRRRTSHANLQGFPGTPMEGTKMLKAGNYRRSNWVVLRTSTRQIREALWPESAGRIFRSCVSCPRF